VSHKYVLKFRARIAE